MKLSSLSKVLLIAVLLQTTPALAKAKKHHLKPKATPIAHALPAHVKTRYDDLHIGDLIVVSNLYRPQYGCGGHIEKVMTRGSQRWYLVRVKSCDGRSFTSLTQLDRDELIPIK